MLKKIIYIALGIIIIAIVWIAIALGPSMKSFLKLEIIEDGTEISYYLGNGGNSGLIIGDSSALLIDTKFGNFAKKHHKRIIEKVGNLPLTIINTHYHQDHIGGNYLYKGAEIIAGNYGEAFWVSENESNSLPSRWIDGIVFIDLGGINVELIPIGSNHTKNDLFIYIEKYHVLFTGDVYTHNTHPVIRESSQPDVTRWENTLNEFGNSERIIEKVIPGHGSIASKKDLKSMANYFSNIHSLEKKDIRRKYKKWYKLPFMATSNKNWDTINLNSELNNSHRKLSL